MLDNAQRSMYVSAKEGTYSFRFFGDGEQYSELKDAVDGYGSFDSAVSKIAGRGASKGDKVAAQFEAMRSMQDSIGGFSIEFKPRKGYEHLYG